LRQALDNGGYKALIEVDGGVNKESLPYLKDVDVLVAGNFIFKNNYQESIALLKS
jgi:pentose-5-phosphate-3-epimerase